MANYEDLQSKVVKTGICTFCGACISACPQGFINSIDGRPNWSTLRKEECTWCDKCYNACYMVRREMIKGLGKMIFGRSKKDEIGVYRRILSARTLDEKAKQFCQDGGIVTSLLIYLLEEKLIDGALIITSISTTMRGLTRLSITWPPRRSIFEKRPEEEEKDALISLFQD